MANNQISHELRAATSAAESGQRRTWSPAEYKELADKLDRLVEAADHLVNHPVTASCDGADSPLRTFNVLDVIRLAAALAAIKLPEE